MALQNKFQFGQLCDCSLVSFNETTGDYNEFSNPGGYGAPNTASSAITSAQIVLLKSTWSSPYTIDFTIASNVITAATVTDYFGNVRDILSRLSNDAFPIINQEWDSVTLFGTAEPVDFEPGTYFVTYTVSDGSVDTIKQEWCFLICKYKACVEKVTSLVAQKRIAPEVAREVFFTFNLIQLNVQMQNVIGTQQQMDVMAALCDECGCGCSNSSTNTHDNVF